MESDIHLLQEQADYYRARAGEYDDWFFRRGRYDRGPAATKAWFAEVDVVRAALDAFGPMGDVLELASGTGLWTEWLLPRASSLTCIDASEEMIALNQARVGGDVSYIQADLFEWEPDRTYDTIFFGFWLSHVPPELFDGFWDKVRRAVVPGGRVFLVDSRFERLSTASDHVLEEPTSTTVTRRLGDGREFQIVKVFYDPEELTERLGNLGFAADVQETETYFLYGSASRHA